MSQPKFTGEQRIAVQYQKFESTKLLITPVQAGLAISYAPQSTWNLLSIGEFPIPTVPCGKRKMVRVADLVRYVEGLEPDAPTPIKQTRRPGRPSKAESIRNKLENKGGAA
jgi:hypothetical protein